MPSVIIKQAKTTSVEGEPWSSPDGQVKIWKVKIETPDGNRDLYSTMSGKIANVGWTGDLELYTNAKGKEYIRQAPKEEVKTSPAYDSNGAKHGNALKIASDYYFAHGVSDMNEDDFVDAVSHLAKRIFDIPVPGTAVGTTETEKQTRGNTNPEFNSLASTFGKDVVADVPDGDINLDGIPF